MSFEVRLVCNDCFKKSERAYHSQAEARSLASMHYKPWSHPKGTHKDYCPDCTRKRKENEQ